MDANSDRGIALISIHPEYADAILEGTKRVEFRRIRFARDVHTVLIYATRPIGKIVASFEVSDIDIGTPTVLWQKHRRTGGISHEKFTNYFAGATEGCAILVGRVTRFSRPLPLESLGQSITPPQSFRYLDQAIVARLVA